MEVVQDYLIDLLRIKLNQLYLQLFLRPAKFILVPLHIFLVCIEILQVLHMSIHHQVQQEL